MDKVIIETPAGYKENDVRWQGTNGLGYQSKKNPGKIGLIRCPKCGVENYAGAVTTGVCYSCGFDANAEEEEIPFVAYGNDELEDKEEIGKTTVCPNCKKKHKVEYGTDVMTGEESKMCGFVHCKKSGESYLVALDGKKL